MAGPLRIALIGAGGYGVNHLRKVERLDAEGLLKFIAVADPVAGKTDGLRARLGAGGVRWFDDYREMLGALADELDAVVISTPIPLHLPMLEAALDLKLAVFIEKPPVPLIQDFLRVNARPESARVALGFKLVSDPKLWQLKRAILDGKLGAIRRISAGCCWPRYDSYYNRAGWAGRMSWNGMPVLDGPATNALAHIIHNIMFLGGKAEHDFAVPSTLTAELYRARPTIETYDTCCLAGKWDAGVEFAASFTHATEERIEWSILVEGEKGTAILELDRLELEGKEIFSREDNPDIFHMNWLDFHAMATGAIARPHTSFADCLGYVATTNAMFLSSREIHPIPAASIRQFERAGGDRGFDVAGLGEVVMEVGKTGRLFTAQGVPWSVPGVEVGVTGLKELNLKDFLPSPDKTGA